MKTENDMRRGVVLLLIAMCLTPITDGLTKEMATSASPLAITFLRFAAASVVAVLVLHLCGKRLWVPPSARLGHVFRSILLTGATIAFVTALSKVPLAYAVGGFLLAPMVSTLGGCLVLGEETSPRRAVGGLLAFFGAVWLAEPAVGFQTGTFLAILGGVLLGIYLVATRAASDEECEPLTSLAVQCGLGAFMLLPFATFDAPEALTPNLALSTLGLGVFAALIHALTVAAYECAETGVLAPIMYVNMIVAVIVGFVFFGEAPSPEALAGLSAIAAGGILCVLPTRSAEAKQTAEFLR